MRVSRRQAAANHERIVEAAMRLLRERGFEGVGLDTIMREAGLTHGGFYGHFRSKEDLAVQACTAAMHRSAEKLAGSKEPLPAMLGAYLSPRHRDDVGQGCPLAALAGDAGRQGPALRRVFSDGVLAYLGHLATLRGETGRPGERPLSIATMAALVGALTLSRAVEDEALSKEILTATAQVLRALPVATSEGASSA